MNASILFGVSAGATLVLATLVRRLRPAGVPAVGGPALLLAVALGRPFPAEPNSVWFVVLSLLVVVGMIDDWRPLRPRWKLALQTLALAPAIFAVTGLFAPDRAADVSWPLESVLPGKYVGWACVLFFGWLATNVANTFDNADGALAGVAAVGLAFVEPTLALIPLGFLVFNLDAAAPWRRGTGVPTAYLGDSGSYLLGLLLLIWGSRGAQGWAALWIPLLDLLRLSFVRWRAGSRPWIGDRRHLAHRLAARGLGPIAVALILAVMTLPGCLGAFLAHREVLAPGLGWGLGLGLGALIFVFAVRGTPASQ